MKYYIKEKLLSLHKRLYVYDETEKQVYRRFAPDNTQ